MSARVHSVPGQTLESTSMNLSSKLSLTCGGNINYCKGAHHPISTVPDEIGNTKADFKTN